MMQEHEPERCPAPPCLPPTMPLGPRVVFTRSAMAMAPTKEDRRAFSPFSSVDPAPRTDCVKLLGTLRAE